MKLFILFVKINFFEKKLNIELVEIDYIYIKNHTHTHTHIYKIIKMSIFTLISIGFIGTGIGIGWNVYNTMDDLKKKITYEKVRLFPSEIISITQPNTIVHVEQTLMNNITNLPIGEVKINRIIKIPTITYENEYNLLTKKMETYKREVRNEVKKTIGKQILFPNIHERLFINQTLLMEKKIPILFGNNFFIKSTSSNEIIERYEKITRTIIPNFNSDLVLHHFNNNDYDYIELEENILNSKSKLYLMVSPCDSGKFVVNAISDAPDKIINHKYKDDIEYIDGMGILSFSCVSVGLILGLLEILPKK